VKLPNDIEREIQAIEHDYWQRDGQHAGTSRLRGLRSAIEAELKAKGKAGKVWSAMTSDERVATFRVWRSIEDCCQHCGGTGKYVYGTTATWRGGIGGAAMSTGVCDKCWGSGCKANPGADLRSLYRDLDDLRKKVKQLESKNWGAKCTS
jgi:hypothetical protein